MIGRMRAWPASRQCAAAILLAVVGGCNGSSDTAAPEPQPPTPEPSPPALPQVGLELAFPNLTFTQPVALLQMPDDDSRWFVVEQAGVVRSFAADAPESSTEVLDLRDRVVSGGERGLLGMAFHPQFATNGVVYLFYTASGPSASRPVSVLARFTSTDGGVSFDPTSESRLLTILQDQANHNGGQILFGPDGFLYAAIGDGGGSNDPNERAQDTANLLGSIIRIDVDGGAPYGVPPGNPFAGNSLCSDGFGDIACAELFAWGLRNPWRFSFDRDSGELWAADVGQGAWEEVNIVEAGRNYGWPDREGANCNPTLYPQGGCPTSGYTDPVAEYGHGLGRSITGGFVYNGSAITALRGVYIMGDYISGRLFAVPRGATGTASPEELLNTDLRIVSFAETMDGELLVVDHAGTLHRLVPVWTQTSQ